MFFRSLFAVFLFCASASNYAAVSADTDPYLWLEEWHSPRVDAWINNENAKTLKQLEGDVRYPAYLRDAIAIQGAKDTVPSPQFIAGDVFNLWRDSNHVRGLWRRTTLAEYQKPHPAWKIVLDLDKLARIEKINWVWKGVECAEPREQRCMIRLSDGGEDAVTAREFDLKSQHFVGHGFLLSKGKQSLAWQDENTLLVAREWSAGDLTHSGYPYILKRLQRGQSLQNAEEIFRGSVDDIELNPGVFQDDAGNRVALIERALTTFQSEHYLITPHGAEKLSLPLKVKAQTFISNNLIFSLAEDWDDADIHIPQGALIALDVTDATTNSAHIHPTVVYTPAPLETFQSCESTRDYLLVTTMENVKGRAYVYHLNSDHVWTKRKLPLPDSASVDIVSTDLHGEGAFIEVSGFLQPPSLVLAKLEDGSAVTIKQLPARFDATHLVVDQFNATSTDGEHIPYFVVHQSSMKLDGSNPTIMYAYGGFQVVNPPGYYPITGKLWLEKGGVFVLANIRGGGEFGPAWHDAGLKTHRQIIYDDFVAVARDLVARGITSSRRLGIQGGSNGGLLMGVQFTQHPELWNAVDIQIPLLDMLRYEQIGAGASWVGEYGSVAVPEERSFLASISPYANIKKNVKYPEPLVWTTTKDDRVGPQHARKFAARLSEYEIPYLFYESPDGGHGAGATLKEAAHTETLEMIYFTRKLMD